MNAANILKPALSRGEIQVIGATTFNEYRKHIEKDTALERRFQPVTVDEPSIEDTLQDVSRALPTTMRAYHRRAASPEDVPVLGRACCRSGISPTGSCPDKAIDLIDEACSGS